MQGIVHALQGPISASHPYTALDPIPEHALDGEALLRVERRWELRQRRLQLLRTEIIPWH
jgi:hypothetical protein